MRTEIRDQKNLQGILGGFFRGLPLLCSTFPLILMVGCWLSVWAASSGWFTFLLKVVRSNAFCTWVTHDGTEGCWACSAWRGEGQEGTKLLSPSPLSYRVTWERETQTIVKVHREKTREDRHRLQQGKFLLDIWKKPLFMRVMQVWDRHQRGGEISVLKRFPRQTG